MKLELKEHSPKLKNPTNQGFKRREFWQNPSRSKKPFLHFADVLLSIFNFPCLLLKETSVMLT